MSQPEQLTILYTAHIAGDLRGLPRLYTTLQTLIATCPPPVLVLDLGASCDEAVWHCAVTNGRSALIVLDGMGYHVANVSEFLAASERDTLQRTTSMGLVDARASWRYHLPPVRDESIIVSGAVAPALRLCIVARTGETRTYLDNRALYLRDVAQGEIGHVQVDLTTMRVTEKERVQVDARTKPDPTIVATVDFVEEEARYVQRKRD